MMLLMFALAIAQAEPSSDIAVAAALAEALIDHCHDEGLACGATRQELGDAFIVRATAAAVLRGELDDEGAANARALVPERAGELDLVLPGESGHTPSPWLREWGIDTGMDVVADRPPPQHALRAVLAGGSLDGRRVIGVELGARIQLSRHLGGFVAASGAWVRVGGVTLPTFEVPNFTINAGELRVGIGPRRRLKKRPTEVFPMVFGALTTDGTTPSAFRRLDPIDVTPLTGATGVGGGLGVWTTVRLSQHVELGGLVSMTAIKRFRRRRFWNPQRVPLNDVNDADADAADRVVVRLNPELRLSLNANVSVVGGVDVQHSVWFGLDPASRLWVTGNAGLEVQL